jgi:hypothetical protein
MSHPTELDPGYDAIIENGTLLFRGTPNECKEWLSEFTHGPDVRIRVVKNDEFVLVTESEYLRYPSQE